jgi:hypothetical protein
MSRPTFPLRFTSDRLRELVRVVAEREGISQNELLERAAEHEVIARSALLADELEGIVGQLRAAVAPVVAARIEASIEAFVEGEMRPDPIRPRQIERRSPQRRSTQSTIGAAAAFDRT